MEFGPDAKKFTSDEDCEYSLGFVALMEKYNFKHSEELVNLSLSLLKEITELREKGYIFGFLNLEAASFMELMLIPYEESAEG